MAATAGPGGDAFDVYFRRADLDRDGRISGQEAVAFFQGANLPKPVLAQIWNYADQSRAGYLGRQEFYNALKLVTVAQRGRELTPDIVKAALFSPAAAKIPAPQINPPSTPAAQINSMATPTASMQMGAMGPTASQNLGFRGQQTLSDTGMNQQLLPSGNHFMGAPRGPAASLSVQGVGQVRPGGGSVAGPHLPNSNMPSLSTDWLASRTSGTSIGGASQVSSRGVTPAANQDGFGISQLGSASGVSSKPQTPSVVSSSVPPKPLDATLPSSQPAARDSKALVVSGNGFPSDSVFGGDVFSATPQAKQETSLPGFSANTMSNLSSVASAAGSQTSAKLGQLDPLQSTISLLPAGSQLQRTQSMTKQNQLDKTQSTSALTVSTVPAGSVNSTSSQSELPWPKISQSDIQKYSAVFVKVDKDRDGKITGEEARNLFLSWRLPREVLKQVWDLSDQDNDSMLSLREFCSALYLMERYREGRPLPAVLPNSLRFDETLLLATGQPSPAYGGPAWRPSPGLSPQVNPGSRSGMPVTSGKPPLPTPVPSQTEDREQPIPKKPSVPVLEKHMVDQLSKEEQSALNSKFQEAADADKKVQELEKQILDSRERIEFYRTKMQELVLYKSRCDNRLNEITERASTDKREFESLAKKYEAKYKEVGDVASKLTMEEATFRDIQERKLELYNAIVKMGQGGSADGSLQDRADSIQSDLEGLVKALNERSKQYGLRAKPTSLIELPFGWQPGIQEGAADWDEDWDKFDNEGFTVIKELTVEVENVIAAAKPKPPIQNDKVPTDEVSPVASSPNADGENEKSTTDDVSPVASSSNADSKNVRSTTDEVSPVASASNVDSKNLKPSTTTERMAESESADAHSENGSASPSRSPERNALDNAEEIHSTQSGKHDTSLYARENNSDHGGAESSISGDKYADDSSWGPTFDRGDDTDSVWNFNPKESDHEGSRENYSFGSDVFGLNPIRTESPSAASVYGKEKGPFFDSVPSTPLFNSGFSPRFSEGPEDRSFDPFAQFDTFSTHDSSFLQQEKHLARFDSTRSTSDYARYDSSQNTADYSRGFLAFDDADPFGSGPFKSSAGHSPRKGTDTWSSF